MNKRSYVISGLIIVGMLYSMAIGPGGGPGGAIRSGMGRIVVLADDWPICDDYWDTNARIFTLNTFDWLTEFSNEKRILKDSHFEIGLTYSHMVNTLQTQGYTVDINDTSSLTLSQTPILLETYGVLLMKVGPIDNMLLTEYVNSGGSVFLVGGYNGSVPNQYDEFLVNFGMSLFTPVNPGHVTLASFVPHPVTTGVSSLETLDPTPILVHSSEPLILATWGGWNWLVVYSEELTNIAPTVTVVSPNGGEYWLEMRTITWTATDPQGDPLTYTIYYSPNSGQSWSQLATGLAESSYQWDSENYYQWNTTTVVGGKNSLIQVVATDGTYIGVDISAPFEIANEQITSGAMQWERTYGGSERDNIRSIIETTDGGYALTGCTWSFGANSGDLWLVKTDSRGEVEWTQIYGNWYTESAYAVIQTQDGGFALVSATGSADESWLVKTDARGEVEWTRTYGSNSEFYDVIQTRDGGYALVGSMSKKAYVQKTDTNGVYQWSWTCGGGAFHSIIPTDNGDYVLAGSVDYDACLVKITTSGVPLWTRTYGGTREQYYVDYNWVDRANTVIQTTDGGFALAGVTSTGYWGAGWYDAWVVKTDAWGVAQWTRTYGGSGWDEVNAVIQTTDGGFALAGVMGSDAWLVIMDAQGKWSG